jgi:hypothetical protein
MGNNSKITTYISSQALFTQEGDSCMPKHEQSLEIETLDAGAGTYFVIKTDRWAFDSIEELTTILNKFVTTTIEAKNKINLPLPLQEK